ncbi:MAG: DUF2852 domain-containing protein [Pseudomonadota bacterium]
MIDTISSWLRSAEAWLDARGKGAWIAAMVLGFIFVWPIGLAILFYMIWSNRMSCKSRRSAHRRTAYSPTGNAAFDEYREETLRRLEEEQTAFHSFMDRLRKAKDKAEFEQFMHERRDVGTGDAPA